MLNIKYIYILSVSRENEKKDVGLTERHLDTLQRELYCDSS